MGRPRGSARRPTSAAVVDIVGTKTRVGLVTAALQVQRCGRLAGRRVRGSGPAYLTRVTTAAGPSGRWLPSWPPTVRTRDVQLGRRWTGL